ncbi:Elongator complex protein 6 [Caenorhabditis elegans]|uniref:Elongator complex protein 6 n=1 Tax=Caenorhabditis elegans TaxID=6239 RepID=Q22963_CAEEL|nr:Elongator complex protein 6 [Caenorhabditis elegans]CCD64506.1 Elongator complex protein 6 [Caenorhabditis elegans]|eukprot:NP_504497.1 Uncharacterized protein CELE_F25B4.4 [Caenorhabditis elegans]
MLKILKGQEESIKGLIVCEEVDNASSLPFVLHFLSTASTSSQKVAIVSTKLSETNYKLICSKAGVRWNPTQISFYDFLKPFELFDITSEQIMDELYKKLIDSSASVILFDDLSILEQFGATSVETTIFVHKIYTHLKTLSQENALLLASFSIHSNAVDILKPRCHVFVQMSPVSHGFGKDASAKAVLTIKSPSAPTSTKGILLSGERTINGSYITVDQ